MGKLHLCVGFYLDGSFKCNTVADKHLADNIKINKEFRPGRFYFVDGEHVCGGLLKEPEKSLFILKCKQKIKDLNLKPDAHESYEFV